MQCVCRPQDDDKIDQRHLPEEQREVSTSFNITYVTILKITGGHWRSQRNVKNDCRWQNISGYGSGKYGQPYQYAHAVCMSTTR